jgi:hypothetical protein
LRRYFWAYAVAGSQACASTAGGIPGTAAWLSSFYGQYHAAGPWSMQLDFTPTTTGTYTCAAGRSAV